MHNLFTWFRFFMTVEGQNLEYNICKLSVNSEANNNCEYLVCPLFGYVTYTQVCMYLFIYVYSCINTYMFMCICMHRHIYMDT